MRRWLRYSLLVLPLLLTACVPAVRMKGDASLLAAQHARERALAPVDRWVLQGRLGVSNGSDGGSGSFSWSQDGDHYEFVLRAPVTGKSFRLSGDNHGALMEGLDGGPIRGRDAESLMHRALGWDVPLSDLRAWVLGLRADSGPAELTFGEDRLPATLLQDGWSVDYREWDTSRQPPLPKKLYAAKPPYKVKLVIESWQLP
ncbi:outer membrane lipoprotein LolB [Rhodanobacter sp. Root627]|uniref:lipoprotein insertase outer membrane protein LolB n=1 Tax=Rhodanobacter sp. Root627 TaxID=1736572 RepID=UPI0006F46658|nr:lipoprotein insertase outer membrane protein LolB [Rhodanobacter sp. Root627]KRA32904.1 outer membrane lipoprotein LolB [Rhodanobacter sp. Root627]